MTEFEKIDLNIKSNKKANLSIKNINSNFNKSPVILIDSEIHIQINGNKLRVADEEYDLSNMLIIDVVKLLDGLGIYAKISNINYVMYPAILLSDFNSETLRIESITKSPENLLENGILYIEAIYNIDECIEIEVVKVFDEDREYDFILNEIKIYSPATKRTKIMYKEKYKKYLLNVQSSKAIEGYRFNNINNSLDSIIIERTNSNDYEIL